PVAEIENLLILPSVITAIAEAEGYTGGALTTKIAAIFDELFACAGDPRIQLPIVLRYCRRRIDRTLKKIDLSAATDVTMLARDYTSKTSALNVPDLATIAATGIAKAIAERDAPELLKWYDNKGVLGIAAKIKGTTAAQFEQWIVRAMRNATAPAVSDAIRRVLPTVLAH
ncbi:MAG: ABC transporter ATP-binding protein, partial [Alphaproteobacteria bacterium]|nr:ABC transporter ATP-binding protein [Alphaproteobacteria bacterium]